MLIIWYNLLVFIQPYSYCMLIVSAHFAKTPRYLHGTTTLISTYCFRTYSDVISECWVCSILRSSLSFLAIVLSFLPCLEFWAEIESELFKVNKRGFQKLHQCIFPSNKHNMCEQFIRNCVNNCVVLCVVYLWRYWGASTKNALKQSTNRMNKAEQKQLTKTICMTHPPAAIMSNHLTLFWYYIPVLICLVSAAHY